MARALFLAAAVVMFAAGCWAIFRIFEAPKRDDSWERLDVYALAAVSFWGAFLFITAMSTRI